MHSREPAGQRIEQFFLRQCDATPDSVAVVQHQRTASYRELDRLSDCVANCLIWAGVRPGEIVALLMPRSVELIAAMLGVMKIGATTLPMEIDRPARLLVDTRHRFNPKVLICDDRGRIDDHPPVTLTFGECAAHANSRKFVQPVGGDAACCILFTSGTTGVPNGVVIPHRAAMSRLRWMWQTYPLTPSDVGIVHRSCSIVGSLWDIFGPLLKGVKTVVVPQGPNHLEALLDAWIANNATHLSASPSLWTAILDRVEQHPENYQSLKLGITAGEQLTAELIRRWKRVLRAKLLNVYGSTECHTPLAFDTSLLGDEAGRIPVGSACGSALVYVVDEHLQLAKDGQPGEIYVGGSGVADGYLGQPAATAQRFIPNCFGGPRGGRLFRTGDLGRWREDHCLEVIGRNDDLVNIHGYKVDPVEVERALLGCPGVRRAVVTAYQRGEETKLAAYLVADDTRIDWRRCLAGQLPSHLIPSSFTVLHEMPMTASGKVDRRSLPQPSDDVVSRHDEAAAITGTERVLVTLLTELLPATFPSPIFSFEELGGDSLTAIRLSTKLEASFGIKLSTAEVFEPPSIRAMASHIDALISARQDSPTE